MLIHYFKITFRNIWKYKTQSLTGIFGLAFAIACFVPVLYWIRYETSYDSFHPDAEDIHRLYMVEKQSGRINELAPAILARKLSEQYPAVEAATSFMPEINNCKTPDISHIRLRTFNTDNTFFEVFRPQFVSGDTQQPLLTEFSLVLTESVAITLFGDVETAIGQQIQSTFYFFHPPYTVTAVVKDPPLHTNLPFDALLNFDFGISTGPEEIQWTQTVAHMYLRLNSHTDIHKFAEEIHDYTIRTEVKPDIELGMLPIQDVRHHLNSDVPFTLNFMRVFMAAGILLLFSAIFNFLNLHLDLFLQRLRELHQRTVHGATRKRLIGQMLFELVCSILLAILFGGCLVIPAFPPFASLLDLPMDMLQLIDFFLICGTGIMALMLFIGWITFRQLSYRAMQPLSKGKRSGQPVWRRITITLQLAVSIVFIMATLVVMKQIRFVNQKDLGINRNGIIQLYGLPPYMERSLRTALIEELNTIPQIQTITTSDFEPLHKAQSIKTTSYVDWPSKPTDENPAFHIIFMDHHFAEMLGLKMIVGEWHTEEGGNKVVINEEAARVMGLTDPVGTIIRMSEIDLEIADKMDDLAIEFQIVGMVNDFHTLSLRNRIPPTMFRQSASTAGGRIVAENVLYIHVIAGYEREVIQRITSMLPDIHPTFVDIQLRTMDDLYDSFNHSEQAGMKIFSILATVCLLISLFGIYAIATASTQRRRREIAIRKVVGAKVSDIVRLFFREYVLLVLIAGGFSLPMAYLAMSYWLQGYAYRTNIPWWLMTGMMLGVILVVWLTVLSQVLKAANSNPGEVVKSE